VKASLLAEQSPPSPSAPRSVVRRRCACGGTPGPDGECAACRAKRLRRSARGTGPELAPPIVHDVLRSSGRPLESPVRAEMEARFGHDFARVRVHTDARAAESARAVDALAYAVGPHVVFDQGRYGPDAREGRELLAHELTHTLQQTASGIPSRLEVGAPTAAEEREAERQSADTRSRERPAAASRATAVLRRTCREHPNRSYYESAENYCRDTPGTGQLHPGQQCFREVPRRTSYFDCPAADQVCFDSEGRCHDSWDEASPVESKDPDGTCNLHFACSLAHAWKDKVIQTWLDQQMEELGRRELDCVRSCENLPWYEKGFCLQGCSGGPAGF
jgi:hypothetical protein